MKTKSEGIFYDYRDGRWNEFNNWPKGKTQARFIAVRNGETSAPFGKETKNDAITIVEDWMRRKMETLGYERFVIIPQATNEMTPEVKARLRKIAAERKKVKVTNEIPETEDAQMPEVRATRTARRPRRARR